MDVDEDRAAEVSEGCSSSELQQRLVDIATSFHDTIHSTLQTQMTPMLELLEEVTTMKEDLVAWNDACNNYLEETHDKTNNALTCYDALSSKVSNFSAKRARENEESV
jgi:cell shape-determining protein MreC